jgi:ubiquinone biosynthesis protein
VMFRGIEPLEVAIRRGARRLALALTAGGALVATAITASSTHVDAWVPSILGALGGALTAGLIYDLVARRR